MKKASKIRDKLFIIANDGNHLSVMSRGQKRPTGRRPTLFWGWLPTYLRRLAPGPEERVTLRIQTSKDPFPGSVPTWLGYNWTFGRSAGAYALCGFWCRRLFGFFYETRYVRVTRVGKPRKLPKR